MEGGWLWAGFTLLAAAAQTARNAAQRGLTERVGTLGATHARFLYGLPFAAVFLGALCWARGAPPPAPSLAVIGWAALGGAAQIGATALMLAAMRERAFLVAIAYTKSEPALAMAAAALALGEAPGPVAAAAVLVATAGVMLMSWPDAAARKGLWLGPVLKGLGAGALFAVSAVAYRGGIVAVGSGDFLMNASLTLTLALALQTAGLTAWLVWRRPGVMTTLLSEPREALPAGFWGAVASQFWFLAFALETAALVRTLGLSEILFAQIAGRRLFRQTVTRRETAGVALLCIGVAGVLLA